MADVLVRGLDVPKNCATCNRDFAAAVNCIYTQRLVLPTEHDMNAGRHPACPILPLQEQHGRLIDADAFLATIRPLCTEDAQAACTLETVKQLMVKRISSAPTVIPKEGGAWYEVHAKRM